MKFQDSSFNGLKVTVGTESVTHAPTHPLTDAPKAICPINFFKNGGIMNFLHVHAFVSIPLPSEVVQDRFCLILVGKPC